MKRLLYVTHVSWGWIKQRPQFLAEELSNSFEVDVFYRKSNRKGKNLNPEFSKGNMRVKGFRNYPFERLHQIPPALSHRINKLFWRFKRVDASLYDFIWVTDPVLWWVIKDSFIGYSPQLIYDCMDDNIAFPYMDKHPKYKDFYVELESILISSANYVFCSAISLKEKLYKRYGFDRNYVVVNNAITEEITLYPETIDGFYLPEYSLTYIGTISEWFDFKSTIKALEDFPLLNVFLFGPKRMSEMPSHPRLHFMGPTEHKNIMAIMKQSSALFMPFIVNELIESVNPVKLYEYIYSGKPVLASRYSETEQFREYVSLYSSYDEFKSFIIKAVFSGVKTDVRSMKCFAMNNTWKSRAFQILFTLGYE